MYTRSGTTWTQQGTKLVGTGAVGASTQGVSVSLSADGNVKAVSHIESYDYQKFPKGVVIKFLVHSSDLIHFVVKIYDTNLILI